MYKNVENKKESGDRILWGILLSFVVKWSRDAGQ